MSEILVCIIAFFDFARGHGFWVSAARKFAHEYGGTAHKDGNSTSKGFLRTYIFQYHFAKVSK
jgi:hypothetical protein